VDDSEARRDALDRIAEIRSRLHRDVPRRVDDAHVAELEALRVRYEMELAAHRATFERLLAEKDARIADLHDHVRLLTAELGRRRATTDDQT
jgi:hypothetical protein